MVITRRQFLGGSAALAGTFALAPAPAAMAATAPTLAQSRAFGLRMLATMRQHEGDRFVCGATGPTRWDCSGFFRWAHEATADPLGKHAGYYLPHNASAIRYCTVHLKLRV
jgi:cell wall-associated NlpC family hydrolase